jgi:hypothetical protein
VTFIQLYNIALPSGSNLDVVLLEFELASHKNMDYTLTFVPFVCWECSSAIAVADAILKVVIGVVESAGTF